MESLSTDNMTEIGNPRRAGELERLVRGEGRYVGDVRLPGMLHLAFARCPHAHARIGRVDVTRARAAPGVVLVLTAEDLPTGTRQAPSAPADVRAFERPLLAADVA